MSNWFQKLANRMEVLDPADKVGNKGQARKVECVDKGGGYGGRWIKERVGGEWEVE